MNFTEKVRKNRIPQPVHPKFTLEIWDERWSQETSKDEHSKNLYESGKVVYALLEEIRLHLSNVHMHKPKVSNEKLLMAYFSISNRDRAILSNNPEISVTDNTNVFSSLLSNNKFSNGLTLEEIANGCVDGIQKAVQLRIKKEEDNYNISSTPLTLFNFLSQEIFLSQLYDTYESYWQALLWGDYSFYEIDAVKKIYGISQDFTAYEISGVASQIRKSRLGAQAELVLLNADINYAFSEEKFILKPFSPDSEYRIKNINEASDKIRMMSSSWLIQQETLENEFPLSALENDHDVGFSIIEALNVLKHLMILSIQITESYPTDDGFDDEKKLLAFCPKIKKIKLTKALSEVTECTFQKTSKILSFLEFDGDKTKDLWCHPIVNTNSASYILLTSALITPVVKRVIENWIVTLGVDLDKKGSVFEQKYLGEFNNALKNNKFITDYDPGISKRIKLDAAEEEIDLLCRIGNIVMIGEAKSIVTTDSPISCYRTFKVLEGAADQVNRKVEFVKNNLEDIFKKVGWIYNSQTKYSFVSFVINSNRMYVGSTISNVPICDEKILIQYFKNYMPPLITDKDLKNLAWFELYDSFTSLQDNLAIYIKSPYQVNLSAGDYEHKSMPIPSLKKDSYKILYKRLVPNDFTPKEFLSREHHFPIKTVDNIEQELEKNHILI